MTDLEAENKHLRHLLFIAHGNEEHYLYGDDGERHCNTCGIDFNIDSPTEIENKLYRFNMKKLTRLQALCNPHTYDASHFSGHYCTKCLKSNNE